MIDSDTLKLKRSQLSADKLALLEKMKRGEFAKTIVKDNITRYKGKGSIPLSFAQERLWFIDQLVPNSSAYNVPGAIKLSGHLNVVALEKSFLEIINRHDALRTTFQNIDGKPEQVISRNIEFKLPYEDLRLIKKDEQKEYIDNTMIQCLQPFDLSKGPLMRAHLLQLDEEEYILLINFHHIVCDGWSESIFIDELAVLYNTFSTGGTSTLKELPVQYSDFAIWQRDYFQGDVLDSQLKYWKNQLAHIPALISLPTDHPRPAIQSYKGIRKSFKIDKLITNKLFKLCQEENVTLFQLLMATFQTLLFRITGENDILVGTPIAGRNRPEIEGLIGFFVNTLVFRSRVEENITFKQLLNQVKETALNAYANQDLPFEKLVEEIQPERNLSHHPLFQVMFALQNHSPSTLELTGVELTQVEVTHDTTKFDIWLNIIETPEELYCDLEYNTDIFESETIDRLIEHFHILISGILKNPNERIFNLPLLSQIEKEKILVEWNGKVVNYPQFSSLNQMVERQVDLTPDAVAVTYEGKSLTYRELDQRANKLAHYLIIKGVMVDEVVGIFMERSLEMVIGILGIMKAGGAYVPIDPDYPKDRLMFMIEDSQIRLLITQEEVISRLPVCGVELIKLDVDWKKIDHMMNTCPDVIVTPKNIAYVIYTSGSTGKPKGAMIPHCGIINRLQWMQDEFRLDETDVILQKTPFSFDVSVWEFFWPLISGARLVMARPNGHKDSVYLTQIIKKENVTTIHFVPSMLKVLLEEPDLNRLTSLHRVICSGEELSYDLQERFFNNINAKLYNLYGPTEASVDVTYYACKKDNDLRIVPIGRPITNINIYILDRYLQPVPVGVSGELHIGGVGLARGYYNRPELTAEKFVQNPFSKDINERLYKTGDLARYRSDGTIEFLGRIDNQVKVRGLRIELDEIEFALNQHPKVRESHAMLREDEANNKRIVAYYTEDDTQNKIEPINEQNLKQEHISSWQTIFNETYGESAEKEESDFNIIGWNSSYTSKPLTNEEMKEFVDNTINRICSYKPKRVLEIGCGTGLLLLKIAPNCELYCGTDISATGLSFIQQKLNQQHIENNGQVVLKQLRADQLDEVPQERYDMIIMNSVVQYFPNIQYLLNVVENSINLLKSDGQIFIGDVRNLSLLEMFHTSVESYKANEDMAIKQFNRIIQKRIAEEEELLIDPEFFYALKKHLPSISNVDVMLKRGGFKNELTSFRYDVVLEINKEEMNSTNIYQLDWQADKLNFDTIKEILREEQLGEVLVTNVPNARLTQDAAFCKALKDSILLTSIGELKRYAKQYMNEGIEPDEFWNLEEEMQYYVSITYSREHPECFDVRFVSKLMQKDMHSQENDDIKHFIASGLVSGDGISLRMYSNNPLHAKKSRLLGGELRTYLKEVLPDYMIPSNFMLLEKWPLSPNGKLDRKALPMPFVIINNSGDEYVAPRNEVEEILCRIWSDVIGIEKVGINNNFFEIGGDSIKSILVISKAYKARLRITPSQMFQYQTIAELAKVVESVKDIEDNYSPEDNYDFPLVELNYKDLIQAIGKEVEVEDVLPLSPLQDHMIADYLKYPEPGKFFVHRIGKLKGKIDPVLMRKAWQRVVDNHTLLRSFMVWEGLKHPVQVVRKHSNCDIEFLDWHSYSKEEQKELLQQYLKNKWEQQLSYLKRETPWGILFIRLDDNTYQAVWSCSYLFMDGWSYSILNNEAFNLYEAFCKNIDVKLDAERSYRDYHIWLRKQDLSNAERYWRENLKGFEKSVPLSLSVPGNHIDIETGFAFQSIHLSKEVSSQIKSISGRCHVTENILLQAVWALLQSYYTGQNDILFGVVSSGRHPELDEVEKIVGPVLNMLPLRVQVDYNLPFEEWLQHVNLQQFKLAELDYTPLDKIHEWSEIPLDQPLFEDFMIFQNLYSFVSTLNGAMNSKQIYGVTDLDENETETETENNFIARMEHPLRFDVFLGPCMELCFSYYRNYFTDKAITRMLTDFKLLMESVAANPLQKINNLLDLQN